MRLLLSCLLLIAAFTACSVHIPTSSLSPEKSKYYADVDGSSEKYRSPFMQLICIGLTEPQFASLVTYRHVPLIEKKQELAETYYIFNDYLDTVGNVTYRAVFIQGRLTRYEYYRQQDEALSKYLAVSIENTFWKAVPMPLCRSY